MEKSPQNMNSSLNLRYPQPLLDQQRHQRRNGTLWQDVRRGLNWKNISTWSYSTRVKKRIWMNFPKYPIFQSKLYLVPGNMFGCEKPGWFRIIFAVTPDRWVLDFQIFESYNIKNRQKYVCWTDISKHICLPISSKPKPECFLSFPILLMRIEQSKHYKTSFRLREGMDRLERMLVWNGLLHFIDNKQ